jgi:hypothetical protein
MRHVFSHGGTMAQCASVAEVHVHNNNDKSACNSCCFLRCPVRRLRVYPFPELRQQ